MAQKLLQRIAGASLRYHGGMSILHLVITIIIITIIIITIIIAKNLIPQQPVYVGTEVEIMSVISSCLAQKQPRPSSKKNWFITLIITSKLLLINIRMNYECHSERATALLVRMTSRQRKKRAGEKKSTVSSFPCTSLQTQYLLQKEEFSG